MRSEIEYREAACQSITLYLSLSKDNCLMYCTLPSTNEALCYALTGLANAYTLYSQGKGLT